VKHGSDVNERLASELVVDAIVPPESLRDEIAARLAAAEGRRDSPPAKWRSVTPV
jgi:acetyl-CoA carboxylase carboxyltransferase component